MIQEAGNTGCDGLCIAAETGISRIKVKKVAGTHEDDLTEL